MLGVELRTSATVTVRGFVCPHSKLQASVNPREFVFRLLPGRDQQIRHDVSGGAAMRDKDAVKVQNVDVDQFSQ